MAHKVGPKTLALAPISICAVITGPVDGNIAMMIAPAASATIPPATRARLERTRSAMPPAGVCAMMPAIPPSVSAMPIVCSFHPYAAR